MRMPRGRESPSAGRGAGLRPYYSNVMGTSRAEYNFFVP